MATTDECVYNIKLYKNMRIKVLSIIDNLNKYNDIDSKIILKLNQNYQIDSDDSVISNRIKDLSKVVDETSNYLKDVIIPSIDSAISKEKKKIAELEE